MHIRIYEENSKTSQLVPTKTGCCLKVDEWRALYEIGPEVIERLGARKNHDEIVRRSLGLASNWYILCGENQSGQLAISIRLMFPTKKAKSHELISTSKGLTFTEFEWNKFLSEFDNIDNAVVEIEQSFIGE